MNAGDDASEFPSPEMTFDGRTLAEIFAPPDREIFAHWLGIGSGADTVEALHAALYAATCGFHDGKLEAEAHVPLKAIYRAIASVRSSAEQFSKALGQLAQTGDAMARVIDALEGLETRDRKAEGIWRDCAHPNRFFDLDRLLSDIVEASLVAEDRQDRIPSQAWAAALPADLERMIARGEFLGRSRSFEIAPRERPARRLIEALAPHWHRLSPHPFTEGAYYKEAGGHITPAVEAVAFLLKRLGQATPRNKVAMLLRNWRESTQEQSLAEAGRS